MSVKKIFIEKWVSIFFVSLLVFAALLFPFKSEAAAADEHHKTTEKAVQISEDPSEKKDPHARFRDGSMGGMMGSMMSPDDSSPKNPHGSKKGGHSLFSAKGLKEQLGLDETQTKKMRAVISEYRKESILKNADLEVAQLEFDEAVAEKGFNPSDVEKKAMKRESLATALTMVQVKALSKTGEILTEGQFEKFMGMLAHRMSRPGGKSMHGSFGHGRKGGDGYASPHGGKGMHGGKSPHGMMGMMKGGDYDESE